MSAPRRTLLLLALFAVEGCRVRYTPPEAPMPPNTVMLSEMMRELSAQPGFTEAMLAELDKGGKKGPALLTPALIDDLRKRILGKDWQRLDRFPGWTMREINPTVRVVGHEAGKSAGLEGASAVHPGAAPAAADAARALLDVGPYPLDTAQTVSLDEPSKLPGFTTDGIVTSLGNGVVRGDGPNEFAGEHAESQRLADVLNRLAANGLDGAAVFAVRTRIATLLDEALAGDSEKKQMDLPSRTPNDLIDALQQSGHTITVTDFRYFANFGHFHYKGQDVMMPFWVNSGFVVPGTSGFLRRGRPLLVPVAHAELEWHIRGPHVNADVSYYFGVDGKSEWRTMDTLDQAWVLKRNAHSYTGADAVEVTRLAGALTIAYMHLHAVYPKLPFGGYYALGVCQDGVAAIEKKMTGKATLFPNTADDSFFKDARDAEVNALIAAIPKDRDGTAPEPERIFGSIPTEDFSAITIPGLGADLQAAHEAWTRGKLRRVTSVRRRMVEGLGLGMVGAVVLFGLTRMRRRT